MNTSFYLCLLMVMLSLWSHAQVDASPPRGSFTFQFDLAANRTAIKEQNSYSEPMGGNSGLIELQRRQVLAPGVALRFGLGVAVDVLEQRLNGLNRICEQQFGSPCSETYRDIEAKAILFTAVLPINLEFKFNPSKPNGTYANFYYAPGISIGGNPEATRQVPGREDRSNMAAGRIDPRPVNHRMGFLLGGQFNLDEEIALFIEGGPVFSLGSLLNELPEWRIDEIPNFNRPVGFHALEARFGIRF